MQKVMLDLESVRSLGELFAINVKHISLQSRSNKCGKNAYAVTGISADTQAFSVQILQGCFLTLSQLVEVDCILSSQSSSDEEQGTSEDAKLHGIPTGYSLKNWDPKLEPILVYGSVFDCNSLGKWIFDWTVYYEGASTPISDMAGDLWILLIQMSHHVKEAASKRALVRSAENREIIDEFIGGGERLMDKLRSLIKACEAPMLRASRKKQSSSSLGKSSGVEFVETLFGRDRELPKTELFMQNLRTYNMRFEANAIEILARPTA